MHHRRLVALAQALLLALLLAQGPGLALAQDPASLLSPEETPAPEGASEEQLATLQEEATRWLSEAERFQQLRDGAPARLEEVRSELASLGADPEPPPPAGVPADLLAPQAAEAEARLSLASALLAELEAEPARRAARMREIQAALVDLRSRLREAQAGDAADAVGDARELATARVAALDAQIAALEAEAQSLDARGTLLTARRDLAARQVQQARARATALREALAAARQAEAEQVAERARQAVRDARPSLQSAAEENLALANRRAGEEGLVELAATQRVLLEEHRELLDSLRVRFASTRDKVAALGLTASVGVILREELASLPDTDAIRRAMRQRAELLPGLQMDVLRWRQQRNALADNMEERVLEAAGTSDPGYLAEARNLLQDRLDVLDQLLVEGENAFSDMIQLDGIDQRLLAEVREFRQFARERVLWVRGRSPLDRRNLPVAGEALAFAFSPAGWAQGARALPAVARGNVAGWLGWLSGVVLLFALSRRFGGRTEAWLARRGPHGERLGGVLLASGAALVRATPLPFSAAALGWLLGSSPEATPQLHALGAGLQAMGLLAAPLEFFRALCAPGGVMEGGCAVRPGSLRHFRAATLRLEWVLLPLAVLGYGLATGPRAQEWAESLGPALQVIGQLAIAHYLFRILDPVRGIGPHLPPSPSPRFRAHMRLVYRPLLVSLPLAFTLLALLGYTGAALLLAERLVWMLLFAGLLLFAWRLLAILVAEQSARLAAFRREEAVAASTVASKPSRDAIGKLGDAPAPPSGAEGDTHAPLPVEAVREQLERLLRAAVLITLVLGLWGIWSPVLPAAGFLSQIVLWPGGPAVVEASEVGAGEVVTLAHLLGAILVAVATVVAARNMPGLIEVVLLKRLPLAPSARFAISTVSRYAIVLVGGLMAFSAINIGWSKVQWLAAAFSVGIGFGLQEIFANFISGLIMLFERPIRIGDIVTVGDVTGKVTQIRMRATVITDFDERELLVPNKEFVTGRLINWTLTDPMTRATIEVGVAYGSDTAKAKELMLEAARKQPDIMREPAPRAFFLLFGDSSLLLRLNYYIPTRDVYLVVKDALHSEIDRAFREAGIEIAFPQMDLHMRDGVLGVSMESRDGDVVEVKEAGPPPAP